MRRALRTAALIESVLLVVAAINLVLVYVLDWMEVRSAPFWGILGLVPVMLIGAVPFLATAWLMVSTAGRLGAPETAGIGVRRLRAVAGFGLPFIVVAGLVAGFAAALLVAGTQGPAAAAALAVDQYSFFAAVAGDALLLVLAFLNATGRKAPLTPLTS
jgi:hypothetical protein